jgi:hypothetical protein
MLVAVGLPPGADCCLLAAPRRRRRCRWDEEAHVVTFLSGMILYNITSKITMQPRSSVLSCGQVLCTPERPGVGLELLVEHVASRAAARRGSARFVARSSQVFLAHRRVLWFISQNKLPSAKKTNNDRSEPLPKLAKHRPTGYAKQITAQQGGRVNRALRSRRHLRDFPSLMCMGEVS